MKKKLLSQKKKKLKKRKTAVPCLDSRIHVRLMIKKGKRLHK